MEDNYRLPPQLLFKSFLIVGGGYLFTMLSWIVTFAILVSLFFPKCAELLSTPNLSREQLFAEPEILLSTSLVLMVLAVHSITCALVGMVVSRISPFAKFNHVIFVAVVVFIAFLQNSLNAPHELRLKFIAMMGAFPVAILIGAKIFSASTPSPDEQPSSEL